MKIENEQEYKLTLNGYMELSKKWALFLLKDMFMGAKRFNDFLQMHPELSNRVLSDQLKGLEQHRFIRKEVVSVTPLKIEYSLTLLGKGLNKMLYEKIQFSIKFGLFNCDNDYFKGRDIEEVFGIKKN